MVVALAATWQPAGLEGARLPRLANQATAQGGHDDRVELGTCPPLHLLQGLVHRQGRPIGVRRGQRLESRRRRRQSAQTRGCRHPKGRKGTRGRRIARGDADAVECRSEELDVPHDVGATRGVLTDAVELNLIEAVDLAEHATWNRENAHVMQHPGVAQRRDVRVVHAHGASDHVAQPGHALAVPAGAGVLGLHRGHECAKGAFVRVVLVAVLNESPASDKQR